MGLFQFRNTKSTPQTPDSEIPMREMAVAASESSEIRTFNDKGITYTGELASFDYTSILRDKQANINSLYQLSDYYVDADPIYRGIIKEVYTPFSIADEHRLIGTNEAVKQKYEDYYRRIHLRDLEESIYYQYFKYGNVYVYLMPDGQLRTLPVHLVRIGNVTFNGEPVLEFNCKSVRDDMKSKGIKAYQKFLEDEKLELRLSGYPPEVAEGLKQKKDWVQLDPNFTYVMQDTKEDWVRYAVPMIASCLKAFQKKEIISNWENANLQLGMRSFVHVKYGDPKEQVLPNIEQLNGVMSVFRRAMTGSALAVTNQWADAEFLQPDLKELFEFDKYKEVNADILSSGGISGVIVNGRADDGSSFATAQVSMQTAALRIKKAKNRFCDLMNKVNARVNSSSSRALPHAAEKNVPKFTYPPVDLSGSKAFQEACFKLWKEGVVSDTTLLTSYGFDIDQETETKRREVSGGVTELLMPRGKNAAAPEKKEGDGKMGRPAKSNEERTSDPGNAETGKQGKPSNPQPVG